MTIQGQIDALRGRIETLEEEHNVLETRMSTVQGIADTITNLATELETITGKVQFISLPSETQYYLTKAGLAQLTKDVADMTTLSAQVRSLMSQLQSRIAGNL